MQVENSKRAPLSQAVAAYVAAGGAIVKVAPGKRGEARAKGARPLPQATEPQAQPAS